MGITWGDDSRPGERTPTDRLAALRRAATGPSGDSGAVRSSAEAPTASIPEQRARPDPPAGVSGPAGRPGLRPRRTPAGGGGRAGPVRAERGMTERLVVTGSPVEDTTPLPIIGPPRPLTRLLDRWVPAGWRDARLDPGRRGAVLLTVVAATAAVVAAVGVWRDRPVAEQVPPLVSVVAPTDPAPAAPRPAGQATPSAGVALVVSVVGKVRHPGLVSVPDGSRVADAIGKAGGPLRGTDLSTLNLARRLADGEQVAVGVPAPSVQPAGPEPGGVGQPDAGPLDLNRATLAQLDGLPGVGPVTAQRILAWRAAHGRFASVAQLREIPGIGERKFDQLKSLVTV